MGRASLLLGLALIITACTAPTPPAEPAELPAAAEVPAADREVKTEMDALDRVGDSCGLDAFKPYLGRNVLDIPPEIVPDTAQIVRPDTEASLDYVPTRVNLLTKEDGTLIGLKCG